MFSLICLSKVFQSAIDEMIRLKILVSQIIKPTIMNKFAKYIFSRFITVFLVVFFLHWIFNIKTQLIIFGGVSNFFAQLIWWIIATIIIAFIGFILLNSFFLLINRNEFSGQYFYKENIPDYESWKISVEINEGNYGIYKYEYRDKGNYMFNFRDREMTILESITRSKNFKLTISEYLRTVTSWHFTAKIVFDVEKKKEKYAVLFFILLAISIWIIKGNPITNNFYGISKTLVIEESIQVLDKIIVPKESVKDVIGIMKSNFNDDEDYSVMKQGYIFELAGVFNGFDKLEENVPFFKCLGFALLERFIHTMMYFLLPFLIGIFFIEKLPKVGKNILVGFAGLLILLAGVYFLFGYSLLFYVTISFIKEHLVVLFICLGVLSFFFIIGFLHHLYLKMKKKKN